MTAVLVDGERELPVGEPVGDQIIRRALRSGCAGVDRGRCVGGGLGGCPANQRQHAQCGADGDD